MKAALRTHRLHLHSAGVATAAGGLVASVEQLNADAAPLGSTVLEDMLDAAGEPIAAVPACPPGMAPARRVQTLVQAALRDLCQQAGLTPAVLGTERLFIVTPESEVPQPELGLVALQAWLDACGAHTAADQSAAMLRVSFHEHIGEALGAAQGHLAGQAPHALVLCAETWLGHAALQWLDGQDLLRSSSSNGVVPGEAAVLLRLARGAGADTALHYAHADAPQPRTPDAPALGSHWSELMLALQRLPAFQDQPPVSVLRDRHASHPAMAREEEFVRRRNWQHLRPDDPLAWLDSAALGYIGRCGPLLQLAALARLDAARLPAIGSWRSLWRHTLVSARPAPSMATATERIDA